MNDFITFACPSCGAALHILPNITVIKCDYCGHEHAVRRQGREIAIEQIIVWPCPECGTLTSIGTGFCPKCGFVLSRDCPNCNRRVYINAIYCPECGVNISEVERQIKLRKETTEREITSRKETSQKRRELINQEIAQVDKEIAQVRLKLPKLPNSGYILLLVSGGLYLGYYGLDGFINSQGMGSGTGKQITYCIFALVLLALAMLVIDNRNKKYREHRKQIEEEKKLVTKRRDLQEELFKME